MTPQMTLVLIITGVALLLFITDRLRMDLVALIVLATLAISGLVTASEALSGFSSPAVVTVWAVFILSSGLYRTGVAARIGRLLYQLASGNLTQLMAAIMVTTALLSAFINNVGAVALLLPVVMDLARRFETSPSKLLMPLAAASLMGGMTTLIGTPPNILINDFLASTGSTPFGFFEFAKIGLPVVLVGIVYMVTFGRRLLPSVNVAEVNRGTDGNDLEEIYGFQSDLFQLGIPIGSKLRGKTISESRLGAALGLNIVAVIREDRPYLAPPSSLPLFEGDQLIVEGELEMLANLQQQRLFTTLNRTLTVERLAINGYHFAEVQLAPDSEFVGKTLLESDFRARLQVTVLAIEHRGVLHAANLQQNPLDKEDTLLLYGPQDRLMELEASHGWKRFELLSAEDAQAKYQLNERLKFLSIPGNSPLVNVAIGESRLGDSLGILILGIVTSEGIQLLPSSEDVIHEGDSLLVEVLPEDLETLEGLKTLNIIEDQLPDMKDLQSEQIGMTEVVLSPHSSLSGKTLREIHFREKYGLNVLAIWRGGRSYRSNLRERPLRFGDAMLVYGRRDRFRMLASEPDFLVLTEEAQIPVRKEKARLASLIMLAVIAPVVLGLVPIAISAIAGAALMVLTGCVKMDEAYRDIEWKAVFLLAGMLPLGIAMEKTGTAQFIAESVVQSLGIYGDAAITSGLFTITALASQMMPNAAVTVLMAPIAMNTSIGTGIPIHNLAMMVAIASSASFLSPVAHASNSLVMGPGGYRFIDFVKVGFPLLIVIYIVTMVLLPIFWPI